jgi:YrbI family 3-deoxy-D-manno-octulosonate 8-phosphate phosphatase
VDGVMTDGGIALDDRGVETKRFHVRDGTAIKLWLKLGYEVAIITGRTGEVVRHRASELGIGRVIQGASNKADALRRLLSDCRIDATQTAALADDLPELPIMRLVGYPMAVADAVDEVRALARFVTARAGGQAAVREAIEHLLRARQQWERALQQFGIDSHG